MAAAFDWYRNFNLLEGVLWVGVAVFLVSRVKPATRRQRLALWGAVVTFVVFGISDWLEAGRQGRVPLWLYAVKIACGAALLACRFTWLGWRHWHWRRPEVVFALFCLVAVAGAIWVQYGL